MKSIIFIFPTSQLGGAERIMFNLAKYLDAINYNVVLFILSNGRNPVLDVYSKESNMSIIYCDSCNDKNLFSYLQLFKIIKINNFDFIFTSHIITNALVSLFLKISKVNSKLISRESTVPFKRFSGYKIFVIKLLYKFFYGKQSLLIFQTDFMKKSLFENLGYLPVKNCMVIPNCVDINNIKKQIINSNFSYNEDVLTIVACGRFIELKQFDLLIKAYSDFISSYKKPTRFILVGDGPMKNELVALSEKLDIADNIIFTGNVKNPSAYFSIADIGIISSTIEGFPNVILEMMIAGTKKIVSTPCTPAIYNLPNILISNGCTEKDMLEALIESANKKEDNSFLYKKYIQEFRSINSFWNKVIENI